MSSCFNTLHCLRLLAAICDPYCQAVCRYPTRLGLHAKDGVLCLSAALPACLTVIVCPHLNLFVCC